MFGDSWGLLMTHSPEGESGQSALPDRPMPAIEICTAVVSQGRAQPGHELLLRQALGHMLREHLSGVPHTQPGWVLQGRDDPRQVLAVHECSSLAHYLEANAAETARHQLANLVTTPVQHTLFRSCAFYENMGVKPALITGVRIEVPPQRATVLDRLLQLVTWPALKMLPELVLRVCYQEAAAPHRFLLVHGWRSMAAYESVIDEFTASVQPALQTLSAEVTRFVARE